MCLSCGLCTFHQVQPVGKRGAIRQLRTTKNIDEICTIQAAQVQMPARVPQVLRLTKLRSLIQRWTYRTGGGAVSKGDPEFDERPRCKVFEPVASPTTSASKCAESTEKPSSARAKARSRGACARVRLENGQAGSTNDDVIDL